MILDENQNHIHQFFIFLTIYYLVDPDFIKRKTLKFWPISPEHDFLDQLTKSQNFVILQLFKIIQNLWLIPFKMIYRSPWFLIPFENGWGGGGHHRILLFCKIVTIDIFHSFSNLVPGAVQLIKRRAKRSKVCFLWLKILKIGHFWMDSLWASKIIIKKAWID